MNNRKVSFHLFGSCHLGNSKGFRSYVPETGTKDQPRFHITESTNLELKIYIFLISEASLVAQL